MQIYFGGVDINTLETSEGMLFSESSEDLAFYYGIEFGSNTGGTDEVVVYDGVDRTVPIDIENVPKLIKALQAALDINKTLQVSQEFAQDVDSFDFEVHVE